jgi:hypothetical protein
MKFSPNYRQNRQDRVRAKDRKRREKEARREEKRQQKSDSAVDDPPADEKTTIVDTHEKEATPRS